MSFKIVFENVLIKIWLVKYDKIWLENVSNKNVVHETGRQIHENMDLPT